MLQRFLRDESGVALGLAVILIVLIGVMGAGLLVFVRNDLEAVVEVNQGHRAFEASDAGVQAAKRELRSNADPDRYDSNPDNNSLWAYVSTEDDEQHKELTFDGKDIEVSIQYLPPALPAGSEPDSEQAPEVIPAGETELQSGCNYFKVRAYGESGPARRGVEAIYCASKLDVPTAYYTPKSIDFRGGVNISGVSFFAQEDITTSGSGAINIDRNAPTLYGDWDTTNFDPPSNLNTVPRTDESSQRVTGAGLAAEGTVEDIDGNKGIYDYDSTTDEEFCRKPSSTSSSSCSATTDANETNPSGTISYPFDPSAQPDLEFLEEEARRQGNHYDTNRPIDDNTNGSSAEYPAGSTDQTVFYMNGEGGDVAYDIPAGHAAKGTIVVENGNIAMGGNVEFEGIMIITGNGTNTGLYKSSGNPELNGFVIADGGMSIRGDVGSITVTDDFTSRPGFYGVELWSWRELYE